MKLFRLGLFLFTLLLPTFASAKNFTLSVGYQGNVAIGTTLEDEDSGFVMVAPAGAFLEPTLQLGRRSQIKFPITWVSDFSQGHQITFSPQYAFHFLGDSERKSRWDPYFNAGIGGGFLFDREVKDSFAYPFVEVGFGANIWLNERIGLNFQQSIRTIVVAAEFPFRAGLSFKF